MDKTTSVVKHGRTRDWGRRGLAMALAGGVLASLTVLGSDSVSGLTPSFTQGTTTNYVVSPDAFRLHVIAFGEDGSNTSVPGGQGSRVEATFPVTPGETLRIFVDEGAGLGGDGGALGTDGANGGGASGVRRGGAALVVAAGGGGAGGDGLLAPLGTGDGGSSTPESASGGTCAPGAAGASGTLPPVLNGQGGGGGQCSSGGAGGQLQGSPGSSNQGGNGGGTIIASGAGGGGGGGFFGGGGGGAGVALGGGGGGGGGSSFAVGGSAATFQSNGATGPSVFVEELVGDTQCSDSANNDPAEDLLVDIDDPGCHTDANANNPSSFNPADDNETDPQCVNDDDDDLDGLTDEDDPGCHTDGDETNPASYNPADDNEVDSGTPGTEGPAGDGTCTDGMDNDGDGLIDAADPGCREGEGPPGDGTCSDGLDNDGDGLTDAADPGCQGNGGEGPAGNTTCSDGLDNDGDGLVDAADPGCLGGTGGDQSDLTVTIVASKARVKAGKTVGYTIRVRNNGPAVARNVEVITQLDKGKLQFKDVTGNGCTAPAPASNVVTCTITTLAPRNSVSFVIEAKTKGAGKAKTTVEAVMTQGEDRAASDNKDREQIRIQPRGKHRNKKR